MPSLDTTNFILGAIATAVVLQTLLVIGGLVWVGRQLAAFRSTVARLDDIDVKAVAARATALMADVHDIAAAASRAGREIERAARGAQALVHVVDHQLDRATGGVRLAFGVAEGVSRRAFAIGAGLREGVREIVAGRSRMRVPRSEDRGAVSDWVNEGGR